MWVMTSFGAFSATLRDPEHIDADDLRLLQVRARRAQDLRTLRDLYMPGASDVIQLPNADYEFRINCTHEEWASALVALTSEIDYRNFKSTVKDNRLHTAYLRVWNALYDTLATNKPGWERPKRKKNHDRKNKTVVQAGAHDDLWIELHDWSKLGAGELDETSVQRLEERYPHLNWR